MSLFEKIISIIRPAAFPASRIAAQQRQASLVVQVEPNTKSLRSSRQLRLGDCLQLQPVFHQDQQLPEVWVLDARKRRIGRIVHETGHCLALHYPWQNTSLPFAQIAELSNCPVSNSISLVLRIPCSEGLWKALHPTHAIDYLIEKQHEQTLVLITCNDYSFDEICRQLTRNALGSFTVGPRYPTSLSGQPFRYSLLFAYDQETSSIESFFKTVLNCVPHEVLHQQLLEELVEEEKSIQQQWEQKTRHLHAQLAQLKKDNHELAERAMVYDSLHQEFIEQEQQTRLHQSALEDQLASLQTELNLQLKKARETDRLRKIDNRLNQEIPRLLATLLPDLQFEGQSMKVLWRHLYDPQAVLQMLQRLQRDKGLAEAKRVQGVPYWMEAHFSSGRSMDGRLYFSQQGDQIHVLICRKKTQAADIRYLKEHLCPKYHRSQLQLMRKSRKNVA